MRLYPRNALTAIELTAKTVCWIGKLILPDPQPTEEPECPTPPLSPS